MARKKRTLKEPPKPGFYAERAQARRKKIQERDNNDPFYINKGWFKPGHDPRRHVFTKEECQVGYAEAIFQIRYNYPKLRKKGRAERALRSFMGGPNR